jgi:hypothetical protein
MRKHRLQMKAEEITALETFVHENVQPMLGNHAADRMSEKGVTVDEIAKAVKFGQVVEIHNEATELRVLMRLAYGKPKVAVCVVVGLESKAAVTTWKNNAQDNHKSLDLGAYQWKVDARQLIGRGN